MYHEPSKQRQLFTRIFVYGSMTVAVGFLVVTLVFYMLGYRFDRNDGRIEQSGLMQYMTTPSGATIEVDDATLTDKSPAKSTVSPGEREFVMWREGYETWRKSLTIEAGTLTWLNYARLVPKDRPVESVAAVPKAAASLASPGGRFMAILPNSATPTVQFYNLQSDEVKQNSLSIAAKEYSDANKSASRHRFELVEWDQSGRYVLMKHTVGTSVEWLVVDREDNEFETNITKLMDVSIDDIHFSGTSGHNFFVLSRGDIRTVDVEAGTLSRPLASEVASFTMYGEHIASFTTLFNKETKSRSVGFVRASDKEPIIIKESTIKASSSLDIRLARYFNQDYLVIAEGAHVSIMTGRLPNSAADLLLLSIHAEFDAPKNIEWLQMSGGGRFVIAQTGDAYVSYDLERMTLSTTATLAGSTTARKLRWLDDYYLWSDRSGSLVMREYDGANEQVISTVAPGFDATLSPNGTYLYSIGKSTQGFQLQRVKMIL